jgi:hypothetical protein
MAKWRRELQLRLVMVGVVLPNGIIKVEQNNI